MLGLFNLRIYRDKEDIEKVKPLTLESIRKSCYLLFALTYSISTYAQKDNQKPLTFEQYEIQVFTGSTLNGTHSVKINMNGMTLHRIDYNDRNNDTSELVNFYNLQGKDLKEYRKSFTDFLKFMNEFDFENHELDESKVILDTSATGKVITRKTIRPSHYLGTRVLIIDSDYNSYYFRYYHCDKKLEKLIKLLNNIIPYDLRQEFKINTRC